MRSERVFRLRSPRPSTAVPRAFQPSMPPATVAADDRCCHRGLADQTGNIPKWLGACLFPADRSTRERRSSEVQTIRLIRPIGLGMSRIPLGRHSRSSCPRSHRSSCRGARCAGSWRWLTAPNSAPSMENPPRSVTRNPGYRNRIS